MLITGVALLAALIAAVTGIAADAFSSLAWLWMLPVTFACAFVLLGVLAFLLFWLLSAVVDMEKTQEKDSKFYRGVMYIYIEALMDLVLVRLRTEGLEKTPKEGRFLLVCNHLHEMDPVVLLRHFPKSQLAFISKQETRKIFLITSMVRLGRVEYPRERWIYAIFAPFTASGMRS